MLISFELKSNIYDELKNKVYNAPIHNITYQSIPIIYNDVKYLLTCYQNLEGLFVNNKNITILVFNNNKCIKHEINNPICVHDIDNHINEYDCFYDNHTNLLLIKFEDIYIRYLQVNNKLDFSILHNFTKNIKISWLSEELKKNNINLNTSHDMLVWDDRFLTLPPKPYIVIKNKKSKIPITGSIVTYNNNLFGIVSLISNNELESEISITPLISILRFLKYIDNYHMTFLLIDTQVINDDTGNKIIITNNIYNKLYNKNKKILSILKNKNNIKDELKIKNIYLSIENNILVKDTIICTVDGFTFDENGLLIVIYNDINMNISLNSYIWLFKNVNNSILIEYINKDTNRNIFNNIKLENINNYIGVNISKIIYFKNDNKYILELNEIILNIFRDVIINYEKLCNYLDLHKYNESKNKIKVLFEIDNDNVNNKLKIKIIKSKTKSLTNI